MNDLNYNAGMSSYQFVNSLASCYGSQGARGGTPGEQTHPALGAPAADYYNPNAAGGAYPNACYSPPQVPHYPQHPYVPPAAATHMQPQAMIDYTQLHPQRIGGTASHLHQHSNPSPGTLSPNLLANPPSAAAAASCKFADSTSTTGVASPQDLSTSTGTGRTSPGFGVGGQTAGGQNPSGKLGLTTPIASPVEHKANVTQNISSPASSTSSNESNEANNSNSGNAKNTKTAANAQANPPQIYPWMKRVHLGQSAPEATPRKRGRADGAVAEDNASRRCRAANVLGNTCLGPRTAYYLVRRNVLSDLVYFSLAVLRNITHSYLQAPATVEAVLTTVTMAIYRI
ncbi:Homeotic protein Sex combs reduced [Eumeta japonica]|uniref:Homeotic protein Sex combs reduced n=1 Tax=Eumeta variegata TaxID=151549 RepID=A0A4C1ZXQ6_EUMVA|nr:Homeotic protein Sex combs reduced [Eumeta japonica]